MIQLLAVVLLVFGVLHATANAPGDAAQVSPDPAPVLYWSAEDPPIPPENGWDRMAGQPFQALEGPVLSRGIGRTPVWLRLDAINATARPLTRILVLSTTWLDNVEVYLVQAGRLIHKVHTGDRQPFDPATFVPHRIEIPLELPPGDSRIHIRVQTPDVMTFSTRLLTPARAASERTAQRYLYGALYGFLLALVLYNLVLYPGLRDRRHILYALYVGAFALMNMGYTGHGFMWLWPESPLIQQWAQPVLMVLFACSGLMLALVFLDVPATHPRLAGGIRTGMAAVIGLLAVLMLANRQAAAVTLAFGAATAYGVLMLALGIFCQRRGALAARYFLVAVVFGSAGALTTAMAVWGWMPFTGMTWHAAEAGMTIEAILLAAAVSARFWEMRAEHDRTRRQASLDPLTSLFNRRAFYVRSQPSATSGSAEPFRYAIVMLDIDHFKQFNDQWGHTVGDDMLVAVGEALKAAVRQADVAARWGGEEFILFLRDSDLHHASHLAERLKQAIRAIRLPHRDRDLTVSVSMGIAQNKTTDTDIDATIARADQALYAAKANGRDQVMVAA